jgi:type VI protein secretion system component Hcp
VRRSRKHEEELAVRTRPAGRVDEAADEHSLAGELLRLQELVGNANTAAAIARSPLQRDAAGTEAAPAKGGAEEPQGVVYTMTVADVGTFELESWSWGATDSGTGGGGGGPGKARFTELSATKKSDKFTPKLMQYAATGQHIATVELRTQKGGEMFVIRLKDVLVSSFQSPGGDPPLDTFMLTFAELEWELGEKGK